MRRRCVAVGGEWCAAPHGLGGGAKTKVGLHAVDGVRLAGVMSMRGTTWLADQVGEAGKWLDDVSDELRQKVDEYMEEQKQEGGIQGAFMSGVDFVGDKLLRLW